MLPYERDTSSLRKRVGGGRCNLVSIGSVKNIHLRLTRMSYPCPRLARNRRQQGRGGCVGKLGLGEPWPVTSWVVIGTALPKANGGGRSCEIEHEVEWCPDILHAPPASRKPLSISPDDPAYTIRRSRGGTVRLLCEQRRLHCIGVQRGLIWRRGRERSVQPRDRRPVRYNEPRGHPNSHRNASEKVSSPILVPRT